MTEPSAQLSATVEDDGPECETCGKTTCPDAQLPAFSEPVACEFAPIYHAIKDAKDCDYGCSRDYTNQAVCLWMVPAIEAHVASKVAEALAAQPAADGLAAKVRELTAPAPEQLRDSAYYFSFDLTGVGIIDRILDALCRAGKGYHNTDGWTEATYVRQDDDTYASTGPSFEEQIQKAADDAAGALRALLPSDINDRPDQEDR